MFKTFSAPSAEARVAGAMARINTRTIARIFRKFIMSVSSYVDYANGHVPVKRNVLGMPQRTFRVRPATHSVWWQATIRPPTSFSGGLTFLHCQVAYRQRGEKGQPGGRSMGLGTSPSGTMCFCLRA